MPLTLLGVSIFRRMGDTELEDDQFYRLYQLMNFWDDEEFKTLLQRVPLDLVTFLLSRDKIYIHFFCR